MDSGRDVESSQTPAAGLVRRYAWQSDDSGEIVTDLSLCWSGMRAPDCGEVAVGVPGALKPVTTSVDLRRLQSRPTTGGGVPAARPVPRLQADCRSRAVVPDRRWGGPALYCPSDRLTTDFTGNRCDHGPEPGRESESFRHPRCWNTCTSG